MDYERALVEADCAFTEQLARDIESERLDGVTFWKSFHAERTHDETRRRQTHERDRGSRGHRPLVRRDARALRGVDLVVPEGGVVALLGPNGAGKTTLVRILSTLIEPDARHGARRRVRRGEAADRGAPRASDSPGQYAAVDETLTGRENLEMVGRLSRLSKTLAAERAAEVLERVASPMRPTASSRPTRVACAGASTSAPVSSPGPRVLLLDEPTTGLDPANRLDLWAYLRDLVNEGATILLTTQYLEEADQLASDVVVIDHGSVIAARHADRAEAAPRRRRARRHRRRRRRSTGSSS